MRREFNELCFVLIALTLIAVYITIHTSAAETIIEHRSLAYDGCNVLKCDDRGLCYITSMYCHEDKRFFDSLAKKKKSRKPKNR